MMGPLCTWTWQDCVDEMMVQRKEIGRRGITWDEAEAVVRGATLLVMCCGDEGELHQMSVESHLHEINLRIKMMLEHGMIDYE